MAPKHSTYVSDDMVDQLADEATQIVLHDADYSKCPVKGEETVMRFLVLNGVATRKWIKSLGIKEPGRKHDSEDSGSVEGSGMSMEVLRGLFRLRNIPPARAIALVKLGRDLVFATILIFLLYRCYTLGGSFSDILGQPQSHRSHSDVTQTAKGGEVK